VDEISGIETTGHEWDGIKELNTPLPRWWLYILYATIVWSVGYWIAMPAWPLISGYTKGLLGHSQRATVVERLDAARAAQSVYWDALQAQSLDDIVQEQELLEFALAGGRAAFGDNCAPCHGAGAQGFKGYPNLNDDDWIWGGTLEDIRVTVSYGIRSSHEETRANDMPAFLGDGVLERDAIGDVVDYVLSLSDLRHDVASAERGGPIFAENCASCHGENGGGLREMGAPNLTDGLWLYGGDRDAVAASVSNGRAGVMPHWTDRLDAITIKQLVVYVHSLGGGQ
jgi:cytochrome c oxidase cbb3-type subunit 3